MFKPEQEEEFNKKVEEELQETSPGKIAEVLLEAATEANPNTNQKHDKLIYKERGLKIKELAKVTSLIKKKINSRTLSVKDETLLKELSPDEEMEPILRKQRELGKEIRTMSLENERIRLQEAIKQLRIDAHKRTATFYNKIKNGYSIKDTILPDQIQVLDDQKNIIKTVTNPQKIPEAT